MARQTYIVYSRPTGSIADVRPHVDEHLRYYEDLTEAGKVFAAGPPFSADGEWWEGEGMIVLLVDSLAEAVEIAEKDPIHLAGVRGFEIVPWLVNHTASGAIG